MTWIKIILEHLMYLVSLLLILIVIFYWMHAGAWIAARVGIITTVGCTSATFC